MTLEIITLQANNPMTVNYSIPIWGIFLFVVGACLSLIKIYVDYNRLKDRVIVLEAEKALNNTYRQSNDKDIRKIEKTLSDIKIMLMFVLGDKIPKGILNDEEKTE